MLGIPNGQSLGRRVPSRPDLCLAAVALVLACSPGLAWGQAVASTTEPHPVALGLYQTVFPDDLSAVPRLRQSHRASAVNRPLVRDLGRLEEPVQRCRVASRQRDGRDPDDHLGAVDGQRTGPAWSLRAAILSGAHDDYIDSWARGLSAYGAPVLLRFAHEMTDQPHYPWAVGVNGNTAAEYVAAWRHVRAIFDRYPTGNVKWVWSPQMLGDASEAVHASRYQSVYPGDDLVDWLGLDVYNTGTRLDWGTPRWRSFREVLSTPYAAITALSDKPVLLAEVGSSETGGSKAEWITSALSTELAAFPRVRALVWFDIAKEDAWTLHSSQTAFEAWLSAASQPAFRLSAWTP